MLLSSSEAYRVWAPSYDTDSNPLLALEERTIQDLLPDVCSKTVLDVGCGTGRSMIRYGVRGARTFGADPSPEMLAEARKKPQISTSVVLADASCLPFANQVADLTVCSFALSYFRDILQSVNELARVTKRSGHVVISDLHPDAAANGWTRSFRVGQNTYEIAHRTYDNEELHSVLRNARLHILTQEESGFAEPERPIFVAAGKEHAYPALMGRPAVRVTVCQKV
jgi:ubiquinone/menaquinone biosynthesis C-methylase UbiE